jgi:hypothetical protein
VDYSIIIAAFISFFTAIFASGIWALIAQRKVNKAKAENTEASTAEIIERVAARQLLQYQKHSEEQDRRISRLEDELQDTMDCLILVIDGGNRLYMQVKDMGGVPIYVPPARELVTRRKSKISSAIDKGE